MWPSRSTGPARDCFASPPTSPATTSTRCTDGDQLQYVNGVKEKLLENETLVQQSGSNSKEQFTNSPDLREALLHAIMDALEAHSTMSTQALGSERVRDGLRDILLGPAQLYEALRAKSQRASATP